MVNNPSASRCFLTGKKLESTVVLQLDRGTVKTGEDAARPASDNGVGERFGSASWPSCLTSRFLKSAASVRVDRTAN